MSQPIPTACLHIISFISFSQFLRQCRPDQVMALWSKRHCTSTAAPCPGCPALHQRCTLRFRSKLALARHVLIVITPVCNNVSVCLYCNASRTCLTCFSLMIFVVIFFFVQMNMLSPPPPPFFLQMNMLPLFFYKTWLSILSSQTVPLPSEVILSCLLILHRCAYWALQWIILIAVLKEFIPALCVCAWHAFMPVKTCGCTKVDVLWNTVILQIFGVVLFSVISVVNGFTEIKQTPKWEKYMERSWQHPRTPKFKLHRTLRRSVIAHYRNFNAPKICKSTVHGHMAWRISSKFVPSLPCANRSFVQRNVLRSQAHAVSIEQSTRFFSGWTTLHALASRKCTGSFIFHALNKRVLKHFLLQRSQGEKAGVDIFLIATKPKRETSLWLRCGKNCSTALVEQTSDFAGTTGWWNPTISSCRSTWSKLKG